MGQIWKRGTRVEIKRTSIYETTHEVPVTPPFWANTHDPEQMVWDVEFRQDDILDFLLFLPFWGISTVNYISLFLFLVLLELENEVVFFLLPWAAPITSL
jgi:hypothetical protein